MHKVNAGYTVLARLKEGCAEPVAQLLRDLQAAPARLPFADVTTVHFATGAVLPAQRWGDDELPAMLMIATSFSGPARDHVAELVRVCGRGLRELFQHCESLPGECSDADLAQYLRAHRQPETFYSGMQHLSRQDVLRQDELRTAIEAFIDRRQAAGGLTGSPTAVRDEIQAFVLAEPSLAWAQESTEVDASAWRALQWRALLVLVVGLAVLGSLLVSSALLIFVHSRALELAVALGWLALFLPVLVVAAALQGVRTAEIAQREVARRPPDEHVRSIHASQCQPVINEMTVVGPIKDGWTRPFVMRLALWIVARKVDGLKGVFSDNGIPTVATARWVAADRGRRLIFISNYTNAAEPYVRDFIDIRNGAMRINLTFGFGGGYPKTDWIILRGAVEDPNGFIHVVNTGQKVTELWFCPYKHLSIDNIQRNRAIREGLFGVKTEDQARAWLHLL